MTTSSPSTNLPNSLVAKPSINKRSNSASSSLQKILVADFAFQLAIAFYCIKQCIDLSELSYINIFSTISQILSVCAIGLLIFKILLLDRYTVIEIAIYLIFCAIALLGAYNFGSSQLVFLVLFIIGSRNINRNSICKTVISVIAVCGLAVILLSLTGFLENRTTYRINSLTGATELRRAFGFTHYNYIGRLSLAAFVCYIYLRYKKFGIVDICFCLVWAALLFFVVSSRTAALIILFAAILTLIAKILSYKWMITICAAFSIIAILASFLMAIFYDPSNAFIAQIDSWCSGRVKLANICLNTFSITPFGQSINFSSYNLILDNGYIGLLLRYGVFALIAVLITYVVAFVQASRNHCIPLIIILTIALLVGFVETWVYTTLGLIVLVIAFGVDPAKNLTTDYSYEI